jgi:hypothetical protein
VAMSGTAEKPCPDTLTTAHAQLFSARNITRH